MYLTPVDLKEIHGYLREYRHTPEAQSMKKFCQHGAVSTFDHAMGVTYMSYYLNKRLGLGADCQSLVVGSFLHDFYLYDWHEKNEAHRWHGFSHAKKALTNANRLFELNSKEQAIIRQHMWPLTIRTVPSCRESLIVCIADKIISTRETLFQRA